MRSRWWILAKFFLACLWTETKWRSINSQLDRTNLVNKGFIKWLSRKFFLRDTAVVPSWHDGSILPARVAQSHRAIWVILPARGASHIIKVCINTTFNSALLMLTKYQKCSFLSAIMISTDTARIRMTVRFWICLPDGPDAIYIFTTTAEILARSLAYFHCL